MSGSVTTGSVKEREWIERLQRFERSGRMEIDPPFVHNRTFQDRRWRL